MSDAIAEHEKLAAIHAELAEEVAHDPGAELHHLTLSRHHADEAARLSRGLTRRSRKETKHHD